jgi:hypothetical protein
MNGENRPITANSSIRVELEIIFREGAELPLLIVSRKLGTKFGLPATSHAVHDKSPLPPDRRLDSG